MSSNISLLDIDAVGAGADARGSGAGAARSAGWDDGRSGSRSRSACVAQPAPNMATASPAATILRSTIETLYRRPSDERVFVTPRPEPPLTGTGARPLR